MVFKLDPTGKETVLYSFTGGADGNSPSGGVVRDAAGNLYGTTDNGGPSNDGVVFKLDPAGQETVLYAFTNGAGGASPTDGVILDPAGNLYGTARNVVFKVDPTGHETVLHTFDNGFRSTSLRNRPAQFSPADWTGPPSSPAA